METQLYFTMQKHNLQKNPLKETKILQDITTLKLIIHQSSIRLFYEFEFYFIYFFMLYYDSVKPISTNRIKIRI